MGLTKYKDLDSLININEIDQEIFLCQKNLFELKLKKLTDQSVKSHFFKHTKRRISQLKFKKFSLIKTNLENK